jgi:dihydrodipicolinate synthase/N-acetylneuraminate lyase
METPPSAIAEARAELIRDLFPVGVPSLWCPLLSHYDGKGGIAEPRMVAHLRQLSPFVKGFLIPGSTGDGWELSERQSQLVVQIALAQAPILDFSLLIGILKADARAMVTAIEQAMDRITKSTGEWDPIAALKKARVCGFTVCPPRGKDLPQEEILAGLSVVLETGLPIALYQLPQVTRNEMSPETVKALSDRFSNFIFFKDTSGNDRVALSRKNLGGVFRVRGAETDYAKWLDPARNAYDGFLLSTANCFARELSQMTVLARAGKRDQAQAMSNQLSSIIIETFQLVSPIKSGNAFAIANKAIDHLFAFGSRAVETAPPRLHDGSALPAELIRRTAEILARQDVLPREGYMN